MNIRIPLFVGLAAAVAAAIVVVRLPDKPRDDTVQAPADVPELRIVETTPAAHDAATAAQFAARPEVAKLIAETQSGDPATRAAAISALAEVPKAVALPVLGRILTDGEPEVDRPRALRSLRDLALNQGDDDGAIRDAIRHAIYHGDDFTKVDEVQEALDVIEESQKR